MPTAQTEYRPSQIVADSAWAIVRACQYIEPTYIRQPHTLIIHSIASATGYSDMEIAMTMPAAQQSQETGIFAS